MHHTFNPLGAILDITLAGYELNKIGIEVAIAVEELVSEGFYREGFLEVGIRLWTVSKSFKSFHGCSAAVVFAENICITFGGSASIACASSLIYIRETPRPVGLILIVEENEAVGKVHHLGGDELANSNTRVFYLRPRLKGNVVEGNWSGINAVDVGYIASR